MRAAVGVAIPAAGQKRRVGSRQDRLLSGLVTPILMTGKEVELAREARRSAAGPALGRPPYRASGFSSAPRMLAEARQCLAFVAPHETGVAGNVCSDDRRQFALLMGQ